MPDYSNGKIYKIYNTITDDIYIGSTTQLLCNRMKNHRNNHKSKHHWNFKLYHKFREHGVENFFIELVESCPCGTKEELLSREGYWIRAEQPSLNDRIAGRTPEQYREDNKERLNEKQKQYAENNREKVLEYKRNYYKNVRATDEGKAKDKQYRIDHKEEIAERCKDYRIKNKDRMCAIVKCECGMNITKKCLKRHMDRQIHEDLMKQQELKEGQ